MKQETRKPENEEAGRPVRAGDVVRWLWSARRDVLLSVLVGLVLCELWMRVPFLTQRLEYAIDRDLDGKLAPDQRGFLWLAGMSLASEPITLNTDGHRGVETDWSRPVVLALGDSESFGAGVRDDEVWTALLEDRIRSEDAAGGVQVVNACHPGHGPGHHLVVLRRILEKRRIAGVLVRVAVAQRNFHLPPEEEKDARVQAAERRNRVRGITKLLPFLLSKAEAQILGLRAIRLPFVFRDQGEPRAHAPAEVGRRMADASRASWQEMAALARQHGFFIAFCVYDADGSPSARVLEEELCGLAGPDGSIHVLRLGPEAFGLDASLSPAALDQAIRTRLQIQRDPHANPRQHGLIADATFAVLRSAGLLTRLR